MRLLLAAAVAGLMLLVFLIACRSNYSDTNKRPGQSCSPAGIYATTGKGTPMFCATTAADTQLRWHDR